MCESEYFGCEHCGARTDKIRWWQVEEVSESASLTEDGEIHEWDGEQHFAEAHETYYECDCGHKTDSLTNIVPEDCECEECTAEGEQAVEEAGVPTIDRDATFVRLVRTQHQFNLSKVADLANIPQEVRDLYKDRATRTVFITWKRGEELAGLVGRWEAAVDFTPTTVDAPATERKIPA